MSHSMTTEEKTTERKENKHFLPKWGKKAKIRGVFFKLDNCHFEHFFFQLLPLNKCQALCLAIFCAVRRNVKEIFPVDKCIKRKFWLGFGELY